MDEVLLYKIIDIFGTMNECICIHLFTRMLTDKGMRSKKNIWTGLWYMVITIIGTYTIAVIPVKTLVIAIFFGIGWSIANKMNILKSVTLIGLSFAWMVCIQGSVMFIATFFIPTPAFDMGGFKMNTWQYILVIHGIFLLATLFIYFKLQKFYFRWEKKDLLLVGCVGYTETALTAMFIMEVFEDGIQDREGLFFAIFLFFIILLLVIHFQQTFTLREKEEREQLLIHDLEQQTAFYQSKSDEEQKVRKLYHDMKNLMLAARLSQNNSSLLNTVTQELEEYGQYYESGNGILNVILKEKLNKAKELMIDMQVDVDFSAGSFLEDRDVVTIFGNALDNAIEACEKLPVSRRIITVKTQQIRAMLSVMIENSMLEENNPDLHSTKEDRFLHGFGLVNIKETAARYDGTCTTEIDAGVFILRILIPIP